MQDEVVVMDADMADELSRILQAEIDREFITMVRVNQLLSDGWTKVEVSDIDPDDIGPWLQENMQGDWRAFVSCWMFELADDATLFILRWS